MNNLNNFISWLNEQVKNHSIYVWGAQGEDSSIISEKWIRKKENSTANANRAIAYWKKQCEAGYKDKLRAFDCSGLGVCFLLERKLISGDMTADGLMKKCKAIKKDKLRVGDFVFKVNSSGKATHIGYVVDTELNVIEARGRDAGVVKAPLSVVGWNAYGRPSYWTDEEVNEVIKKQTGGNTMATELKITNPLMHSDAICELQEALNRLGYDCGEPDGICGKNTMKAVQQFADKHTTQKLPESVSVTVKADNVSYTGTVKNG